MKNKVCLPPKVSADQLLQLGAGADSDVWDLAV